MLYFRLGPSEVQQALRRAAGAPRNGYRRSIRGVAGLGVGLIGEWITERWWDENGIPYFRLDSTRYDYIAADLKVEIKTKDRTVRPRLHHAVTIPAYSAQHQDPDWYLFHSLVKGDDGSVEDWLLGGMPRGEYHERAVLRRKGETDPNGMTYSVDCLNLPIRDLYHPEEVIRAMESEIAGLTAA